MTSSDNSRAFLRQVGAGGRLFSLSSSAEIKIGREPDCDIVLDSNQYPGVSRYHMAIRPLATLPDQGLQWEIGDLGSSNGTFINGQRLAGWQPLAQGDHIVLGAAVIEFIFEARSAVTVQGGLDLMPDQGDRDGSRLSMTQLLPILSTGSDLTKKAFLIPGVVTVLCVVGMFATLGDPKKFGLFALVLGFYLAAAAFYVVYHLCGKAKPWWLFITVALSTGLLILFAFSPFEFVFRRLLPGNVAALRENAGFFSQLFAHFFGAGMLEELLKAVPIFVCYAIGQTMPKLRDKIGVREPLDGILLGAASAVGFTLLETLGEYVPDTVRQVTAGAGLAAGQFVGLQLLIPRVIGAVAGHMAYSGYFGYFIGLAALKPSKKWIILPIGYLTASSLHALWNASASVHLMLSAVVGIVSYAFLAAAILKARELSPTRNQNFATRIR
ncbi:MAG: PrsW family glutamic-type intramembrane protease [Pseudanabaena sp. ELA607]